LGRDLRPSLEPKAESLEPDRFSLIRPRVVLLRGGVNPSPCRTEQRERDNHHQCNGDDDVHAIPHYCDW